MTTITITDDDGTTATGETVAVAKRAIGKARKALEESRRLKRESEKRASTMAYAAIGTLACHAGPKSWGQNSEVCERGSRAFGIYASEERICLENNHCVPLSTFRAPVTALYVSPIGYVMAVRVRPQDGGLPEHWRAVGADGETVDSVRIPESIVALFPSPTADEPAPAPVGAEGVV